MLARARPSVVRVEVVSHDRVCREHPFDPTEGEYFGAPPLDGCLGSSVGSGVVAEAGGFVLTNHHVVANAVAVRVVDGDGRRLRARLVGSDPPTDLAVVQVEGADLRPARFASGGGLRVGDHVFAFGVPFGLPLSASSGMVSALPDDEESGFLQTDAPLNPGNSGGPLLDDRGEVVGINVAILRGAQGIGFAIPVARALRIYRILRSGGGVVRGTIGVELQPLTPALLGALGLPDERGALVADVRPGGPAERAGIRRGDLLRSVGTEAVGSAEGFERRIRESAPGARLRVGLLRDGRALEVEVAVDPARLAPPEVDMGAGPGHDRGVGVTNLTEALARDRGLPWDPNARVLVAAVHADSGAAEAGLEAGDLILEVDRRVVPDVASFRASVEGRLRPGERFLFLVRRGGATRYMVLTLPPPVPQEGIAVRRGASPLTPYRGAGFRNHSATTRSAGRSWKW